MKCGYLLFLAATATALTIDTRHVKGKAQSQTNKTVKALGRYAGAPTVVTERDVDMEAVARELGELVARHPKRHHGNANQGNAGQTSNNNTARLIDTDTKDVAREAEIEKLATRVHELEELVARHHKDKAAKREHTGTGHKDDNAKNNGQGAGGTPGNNTVRAVDGVAIARKVDLFARTERHV